MTPRERWLAVLRGQPVDRVPLSLPGFQVATPDQLLDPARREIWDRVGEQLPFFYDCPSYVNRYLVTPPQRMREVERREQGGTLTVVTRIDTPRGPLTAVTSRNADTDTIWTEKYPVESLVDLEKMRSVPWERPFNLAPPQLASAPAPLPRRGLISTHISSPFVCVAGMMRYEWFLELCATELGLIQELTALCLERILDVLEVVLAERTVEYVWIGGCEWLTPPMGSPDLYDLLVQEPERRLIERIHNAGGLVHVHCHGRVQSTLERVIERGGDYFEPVEPPPDGDVTFAEAKRMAQGRITLGGNVEARLMECGDVPAVEQAARAAFEGGRFRMVLQTTAGPISTMTSRSLANYHRLVDVWEELSPLW